MSQASRRSFLALAGTGAITTTVVGSGYSAAAAPRSTSGRSLPLVAHVRDAAAGTIVLYVGNHEIVVQDHDLVRRLSRAARH